MDWFFGNDPENSEEARRQLMTVQALTALTFVVGVLAVFAYLNYVAGVAANAVLVLAIACLVVCPMAYAHALELRRHVVALGGKLPLSTDDVRKRE